MSSRDLSALDRTVFQPLARLLQEAFAHGLENDLIIGKMVSGGSAQSLYEVTDTQNYEIGATRITRDFRVYQYAKSDGACISGQGAEITAIGLVSYQACDADHAVGATTINVPACTHDAITENELKGGYCIIYNGSDNNVQFRRIETNEAADANALFSFTIDGGLNEAMVDSTSAIEVFQNPLRAVHTSTSDTKPVAGVPASKITAADKYFWLQRSGPCWCAPQGTVIGNEGKGVYWRHDGSLDDPESTFGLTTGDVPAGCTSQYAGHLLEGDYAGVGPLLNLGR